MRELQSGAAARPLLTANAYLGRCPYAGRWTRAPRWSLRAAVWTALSPCVLMHCHGWGAQDHDLLAQGSLAGHIIECGCRATGGLHTDWGERARLAAHRLPHRRMRGRRQLYRHQARGYRRPGQLRRRGRAIGVMKLATAPLPAARRHLRLSHVVGASGAHRVQVRRTRPSARAALTKVSATWVDGFRCTGQLTIVGIDAVRKGRAHGRRHLDAHTRAVSRPGLARLQPHAHRSAREPVGLGASMVKIGPSRCQFAPTFAAP